MGRLRTTEFRGKVKVLETENSKLKKLLAERDLEIDLMREINRKKW